MNKSQHKILSTIIILGDLLAIFLGWIGSYYLRFHTFFSASKGVPESYLYFKLTPFLWIIWLINAYLLNFYKDPANKLKKNYLFKSFQMCFFTTLLFIVMTYFYDEYRYSRGTLIIFSVSLIPSLLFCRSFLQKIIEGYLKKMPRKKFVLITDFLHLDNALSLIHKSELARYSLEVIFFNCDSGKHKKSLIDPLNYSCSLTVVDCPSDWISFLTEHRTEKVFVSLSLKDESFFEKHLETIADQVTDVKIIPDLISLKNFRLNFETIDDCPIISLHDSPLMGHRVLLKRCVDILGSIAALLIFSPIILVSMLLIRFSSAGPLFYYQERMGIDGKFFKMIKFRTMIPHTKSIDLGWTVQNDQRVTSVGKWLRKLSFDEFPQLINVLKGDMSLVGPRPERPEFVNQFRKNISGYMLRHKVKSGMTGWAQINGWRGDTSIEKRIECDLFYVRNWSLMFDFKILFLTVFKGFRHPNAY